MDILQAIILGIIEGLTEFLPVSSTGHLIIAEEYMKFYDPAKTFAIAIQFGAVLALVWYYRQDIVNKIQGLFASSRKSKQFFLNILIATIPAGILGLALNSDFEAYATPKTVAVALIAGAVVLWLVDRAKPHGKLERQTDLSELTIRQAILIGFIQCASLIPGVSRSGAAIVGGLMGGLNRVTATAFSFYLGIIVLGGASLYKLATDHSSLDSVSGGPVSILIGTVMSFVVALAAVSWLLKYVSTHDFKIFVYWRILLGILVLVLLV